MLLIVLTLTILIQLVATEREAAFYHQVAAEAELATHRAYLEHLMFDEVHDTVDEDELNENKTDRRIDAARNTGIQTVHNLTGI